MEASVRNVLKWLRCSKRRDPVAEWRRLLGDGVHIGVGTVVREASLIARAPEGCRLVVGEATNVQCRIVLERAGARVRIGSRTHVGSGTLLDAAECIEIGDDVLIAFGVLVMDHNSHSLVYAERRDDVREWMAGRKDWTHVVRKAVRIRDKAWIGAHACILKGIEVGEGAIVGTASVVTRDVPPWTIVGGNPARVIRELTPQERAS